MLDILLDMLDTFKNESTYNYYYIYIYIYIYLHLKNRYQLEWFKQSRT